MKTLFKQWLQSRSPMINQAVFKAVGVCSSANASGSSYYFRSSDFSTPVIPSMMKCLGAAAENIEGDVTESVKLSEVDGCTNVYGTYVLTTFNPAVKATILTHMNKYLKELQKDKKYFSRIQTFINRIPKKDIATKAYLSCVDFSKEESCYKETVSSIVLEELNPLNLPQEHASELVQMYLSAHSISEQKNYFKNYFSRASQLS